MNKFTDYCSSFITPQMTLLEKFNALLDYLKDFEIPEMDNKPIVVEEFTNYVEGNINPLTYEPTEDKEFKGISCPLEIYDNENGQCKINTQIQLETFLDVVDWYEQIIAVYQIGNSDYGFILLKSPNGKYYFWKSHL